MKVEEEVVMELEREEEEGLKEKEEMEAMMDVEGEETEVVEEVSLEFGLNKFSANGGGAYMIDMCICVCSGG